MDDIFMVLLVAIVTFAVGFALGLDSTSAGIEKDCRVMGHFRTGASTFTCAEKKP